MYDIIIIGAGPAGLTASVYAGRAEKSVLIIEGETFGGQITHSPRVENYPGFIQMSGNEFADKLVEQAMAQSADIELDKAVAVEKTEDFFTVKGERAEYRGKSVIIATGAAHRKLGLDKEDKFTGEGVSYCAVCDGAFYNGKEVAVIGGGNSALQEAVMLSKICKSVTVIQNLAYLTGEPKLQKELEEKDNVRIILSSVVKEIHGDELFRGITIENTETNEASRLDLDGIFVAIGQQPMNEPFRDIVGLNDWGYIEAGEDCLPQGEKGIFVAGDCRSKRVRQIATAIADGAVAALAACSYVDSL